MAKIAQIITLSEYGGAQKHILILSNMLKKNGYDVDVISGEGDQLKEYLDKSSINNIKIDSLIRSINPIKDFKALFQLVKIIKKNNYDIVHCHSSKAGLLGRIAAKIAGVKCIVFTAHGFVFNEPMSSIKKRIYIIAEKFAAHFGHKVITVSQKDYNTALQYNITTKEKLVYIPNALEKSEPLNIEEKSKLHKELHIDEKCITIGCVANFFETKGYVYLIEALNRLNKEGYPFQALLIGNGPKFEEIKEMAINDKNIRFLGFRDDAEKLINIFDVFVLASIKEGMPYVILEAMGKGIPVLCTKVGALTDIIKHKENGFIVDPANSDALYEYLKEIILGKYDLKEIGKKGNEFIDNNFNLDDCVNKIIKVYEKKL